MSNLSMANMKIVQPINTIYYGVYTPNDNRDYSGTPNVFEDKIEALKVAKMNIKSRFKAFNFYHEAVEFALNGSEFPNNNTTFNHSLIQKSDSTNAVGEKANLFKGPKPQELIELRKAIERGNYKLVKDTIWQNPRRYLVSSRDRGRDIADTLQMQCWKCGDIFCQRCITKKVALPGHLSQVPVPVCKPCFDTVTSSSQT